LRWHLGIDHEDVWIERERRDRGDVVQRIDRVLLLQRAADGDGTVGRQEEGVAVGLGLGHRFERDRAAGPGAILDHDRLPGPLAEPLAGEPPQHVGGGARRALHDDADRLG
jgi:hypothetical protein